MICCLLAAIFSLQGKFVEEMRGMYECYLAISIRNSGPDAPNTATGNCCLGSFHHQLSRKKAAFNVQQTQLLLVKSHYKEGLRIHSKIYGPTHPENIVIASRLADDTTVLSRISSA
jgi:hypothetical protein